MIGMMASAALVACPPQHVGEQPRLESAIRESAVRFHLPLDWIRSVMMVESGGRPCRRGQVVRSRAGAIGVMQIMKPTWHDLQRTWSLGARLEDPAANVAAGAAYLREMYDRFGFPGLFAAYNAGPARYQRSLSGRRLPAETRAYLRAVLNRLGRTPAGGTPAGPALSGGDRAIIDATMVRRPEAQRWDGDATLTLFFLKRD
jgi:soluble lytic murein transglycosylase-like protein